ncbi:MAG: hypothetical protein KGL35_17750 [Bradyrhizobium sp.]|nr:hypothetical protein [Bradyrhizobium sp.]
MPHPFRRQRLSLPNLRHLQLPDFPMFLLWLGLVAGVIFTVPVSNCHPTVDADAVLQAVASNEPPTVSLGAACKF